MGLSADYTAILFDGAPLYSGLAKVYGADLSAIFIDRIEVVKGGSSVLYGPEAMAGVVNLITDEPIESGFEVALGVEIAAGDATTWEASARGDYVDTDSCVTGYVYHTDREGLDLGATDSMSCQNSKTASSELNSGIPQTRVTCNSTTNIWTSLTVAEISRAARGTG